MKILNGAGVQQPHAVTLDLSQLEITALRAAVGEICHGFDLADFNTRIGATRDQAECLFQKLDRLCLDGHNLILLTREEMQLLKNAHKETLNELGASEYATRTGVEFTDGLAILEEFGRQPRPAARS